MFKKTFLLMLLTAFLMPWAANAQQSLPYEEGFEDYGSGLPTGWTIVGSGTVAVTSPTAANVHNGSKSLQFSGSKSNVVALPQFTAETNTLQITFYTRPEGTYSASKDFDIGYITDLTDASTFVALETYNYADFANSYLEKGPVIMSSAPDGAYIAFRHRPSSTAYYWFVDDITVESIPSCPKPTLGNAQNITEASASFQWTENGSATNWVFQYSTSEDFTNATSVNAENTPAYAISNLTPLTTYYVRVKSDCGGGEQSSWSTVVSFTTTAVAQNVGDAWSDDFEGTSCGWELINGTLTNKWCWGEAVNNGGTHGLYVSNDNGATNNYSGNSTKIFAAKLLSFTDGKYEFAFNWMCKGESTYDFLRVALVPASVTLTAGSDYSTIGTTSLPTGWIALDGGSNLNLQTTWQVGGATINVTAGSYYLVLIWRNDSGIYPPAAAVDNVSITKITCDQDVTDLTVNDITTNSATLSWEGGEATQWQVAYCTTSTFEGATEEIIDENTYNLTGLEGSNTYYVKVRAYCGGEDFGSWSNVLSFATACEAIDLNNEEFTENFDGITLTSTYSPSTRTLPLCWNYINTSTYASNAVYPTMYYYSYTNYSNSTPNSLRFYSSFSSSSDPQDEYAILPAMDNLAGKQITLWIKGYNATTPFKVGLITNPTDASTFVEITNDANPSLSTSYQEFTYIIPADATANYVAIMMEAAISNNTTRGLYIDDIKIANAPTCEKPKDLIVTDVNTTTAIVSWTNGADDQTAWQICLNGDEENLIMAESNPFTIEDLTAATAYTAKVRAYCGEDDQSDWSNEVSFATLCEAITTFPWTENFNSLTAGIPTCWDNSEGTTTTLNYRWNYFASGHEGAGLRFNSYNNSNGLTNFLKTVSLSLPSDQLMQLSFWYKNPTGGDFSVYISTDGGTTHETALATGLTGVSTWTELIIPLADYAGQEVVIVFKGTSNYGNGDAYIYLDDVTVMEVPTCMKPTDLEVTATTTTTATFSWTAGADETAWQICLNGDETNLIMAESNPFTVEGLTVSTAYTAKVRAYCNADDQSDWSNEVSFATECEAIVVDAANPFTEGFEGDWTPLCWESIPYIDGTTTRQWTKNTNSSYTHSGAGAAYSGYYGPIYLVMPDLQLGTNGDAVQLTFWSYNSYVDDYDKNSVVLLDGENEIELWSPESVVQSWEEVTVDLTAYMGQTISLAFKYEGNNAHGWYVDDVRVGAPVSTYTLEIEGYEDDNDEGGYYLIASPVTVDLTNHDMTTGDFDLYYFDQAQDKEWINYEGENGNFSLEPGKGYLYAKKATIEGEVFEFTLNGTPYDGDGIIELVYDNNANEFKGWNLVGNPWGVKAYPDHEFYTMAEGGAGIDVTPNVAGTEVAPMTGIFVVAEGENETVTFATENPNSKSANLALNITNSNNLVDRAIVRFGEGRQLPKFQLNRNHTKVFIPQEGKDYAVVNAEEMGEMPVSFKAEKNGTYTFNANAEEVNFSYLHLIDNMTGNDIDLLANPSYSFDAKTTDYANRFKLVFATSNSINGNDFAFISNNSLKIFGIEGQATLKVMDVTGRTLSTESFSGSYDKQLNLSNGVYLLQLIQGNNVKTQKIVVK